MNGKRILNFFSITWHFMLLQGVITSLWGYLTVFRPTLRFFGYQLDALCTNQIIPIPFLGLNPVGAGPCVEASNIVAQRVSTWNSAHATSYFFVGMLGLFVSIYPFINLDGLRGLFIAAFAVSFRELTWYLFYFAANPQYLGGNLIVYSPWLGFMGGLIILLILMGYHKAIDWKLFTFLSIPYLGFMLMHLAIGFPITIDLKQGVTPWYNHVQTDLIEVAEWLVITGAVAASYYVKQRK